MKKIKINEGVGIAWIDRRSRKGVLLIADNKAALIESFAYRLVFMDDAAAKKKIMKMSFTFPPLK